MDTELIEQINILLVMKVLALVWRECSFFITMDIVLSSLLAEFFLLDKKNAFFIRCEDKLELEGTGMTEMGSD